MTLRRLMLIEAEKLMKAPVFWVAPIVLALYLVLMLFGFEVYAAKNGVDVKSGASINDQMTGSIIVSAYATVKGMALNVLGLSRKDSPRGGGYAASGKNSTVPVDERDPILGKAEKFDYWRNFVRNLVDPPSFPRPKCDCPCDPARNGSHDPAKKSAADAHDGGISLFHFVGTANASELKPLPPVKPEDSFMERLQKRINWLTESVPLEEKLIDRSRFNGLRFTYLSMYFAFVFIFPLMAVSVVAYLFASEISHGTIRTSLLRPIRREQLLFAKVAIVTGYLVASILAFIVAALLLGSVFCGYGNLVLDSEMMGISEKGKIILADGAVLLFLTAVPVAAASLLPLACFAILLSHLKPEPTYVVGVSSIVYMILFSLGGLPLFEDIRALFFTTYMDAWPLLFDNPMNVVAFVQKLSVTAMISFGAIMAVKVIFLKRDIFE